MLPKYELHMHHVSNSVPTRYKGVLGEYEILVKQLEQDTWQASLSYHDNLVSPVPRVFYAPSRSTKYLALNDLLNLSGIPKKIGLLQTGSVNPSINDVCQIIEIWDNVPVHRVRDNHAIFSRESQEVIKKRLEANHPAGSGDTLTDA